MTDRERNRPTLHHAYAIFCDGNNLQRIDASPEQVLDNLDLMLLAISDLRIEQARKIAARCPRCGGKGSI